MNPAKKEELKSDREAINNSCMAEATTAGCKSAMQKLHNDKATN